MSGLQFTIRRKLFTIFGAKFHIYNAAGDLMGFCKQKAFKLKEDIRFYTNESMSEERFAINARSVIDFSSAYDIVDSSNNSKIGAIQRKGIKSIIRDSWLLLDEHDAEIGKIEEDSTAMGLVRRFLPLGNLIPQVYHLKTNDGRQQAEFRTHFNPFVHKLTVTVYEDCSLNPLLILAGGVLLVAIEGRQQ